MSRDFSEICPSCGFQCMTVEQCHKAQQQAATKKQPATLPPDVLDILHSYRASCLFNAETNEYGAADGWRATVEKIDAALACQPERESARPGQTPHEAYRRFLDYELDGSQNISRTPAQYNDILASFKAGTIYGSMKREISDREKALEHEYVSTRGLWCTDQDPKGVSYEWIKQNAFQLKGDL